MEGVTSAPGPSPQRPRRFGALRALLCCGLLLGGAGGEAAGPGVRLSAAGGAVEVLSGVWNPAQPGQALPEGQALRTGVGRATLSMRGGQVLLGSASQLRVYHNEPDLLAGQAYLRGQDAGFYALGRYIRLSGRARLDLRAPLLRVIALSGSLKLSSDGQLLNLRAGEGFDFGRQQTFMYQEQDAWYDQQFLGSGEARIEATAGPVELAQDGRTWQPAVAVARLSSGGRVRVGAAENSWAEIGFSGGGYLRLQPGSELSVTAVERCGAGRQVYLRLERGSAWNVVARGKGGYQLTTPTLVTAVRGTVFRLDAGGTLKVFEGRVAAGGDPATAPATLAVGQQRVAGSGPQPLVRDAQDELNLAQDQTRAEPLRLRVVQPAPSRGPTLAIDIQSQPTTQLRVSAGGVPLQVAASAGGFRASADLPEGWYEVQVRAERYGRVRRAQLRALLDRSGPQLSPTLVRRSGRLLELRGSASDNSGLPVRLSLSLDGRTYTRTIGPAGGGRFAWLLPLAGSAADLTLRGTDAAGNHTDVALP